jgi:hypothetical protein
MLSFRAATDRATRRAIATGDAVNIHIIHASQRSEGYEPCFGRAVDRCEQTHCAYHEKCMALIAFDANTQEESSVLDYERRKMPTFGSMSSAAIAFPSAELELVVPDVIPIGMLPSPESI